jgi:hypothetical protein
MDFDQVVGIASRADGFSEGPNRIDRQGADVVCDARGRYGESTQRGQLFSLALVATTTGVAAGNIVGAAGAAVTQFAIINPANSGKNLELIKFGMGVISGTPGAGPLFHGFITGASSISAVSPGGTIRSNLLGGVGNSVATPWSLAAGSALTGGLAPVTHRVADFAATNTAQAVANGHVRAIELIDGDLIVPPNTVWLPLWGAAGTTLLNGYSITWQEVPI